MKPASTTEFDVIVVDGGHAGVEAAVAATRVENSRVALVTSSADTIGQMSCNPAIGGIAKGTVAREVDALGGVMGRATDRAAIQFRMLNRGKCPAVWAPRAQCDRVRYRRAVQAILSERQNLTVVSATVSGLTFDREGVANGIRTTDGSVLRAHAVVIATGTFLRGRIFIGTDVQVPGGRADERLPQLPCWLTWAGDRTKQLVSDSIHRSAMYGGAIGARGPRYCPSIEDKIVRFPDAEHHQVFLEPEGLDTPEMCVNGLSTSLPVDVQVELLRSVPGLESVAMTRPGCAIEYDYCQPTGLFPSLESRTVGRLFFAGQVNGTTGYEEEEAQGVVAGLSAGRRATGLDPVVFGRETSETSIAPAEADPVLLESGSSPLPHAMRIAEVAKRNGVGLSALLEAAGCDQPGDREVLVSVELELKYAGYFVREQASADRLRSLGAFALPNDAPYASMRSLSTEAHHKLEARRQVSLAQAASIPGVRPSDLQNLVLEIERAR